MKRLFLVYKLVGFRRVMLINACELMPVRIAQIGNIKLGRTRFAYQEVLSHEP